MNDKVFIVIELQTNGGTVGNFITTYPDYDSAVEKYYQILAAAVKSNVEVHTAVIMTETGRVVRSESFTHESEGEE